MIRFGKSVAGCNQGGSGLRLQTLFGGELFTVADAVTDTDLISKVCILGAL